MDVEPEKEDLFTEGDDTEHVPTLLKVPGVHAVTRLKGDPFAVSIGGAAQHVAHTGPRYSALSEIEGPHVLVSAAWAAAVELGRWRRQVRPYTRNRRHARRDSVMFDLVIQQARTCDGTGKPSFVGALGVTGGMPSGSTRPATST